VQPFLDRKLAVMEAAAGLDQELLDGLLNLLDQNIAQVKRSQSLETATQEGRAASCYTKKEC